MVLFCTIWYYYVLLGTIGYYWVLLGTIGYYWVLLGTIGYYWLLLATIGYYWVLLETIVYYLVPLGTIGNYWKICIITVRIKLALSCSPACYYYLMFHAKLACERRSLNAPCRPSWPTGDIQVYYFHRSEQKFFKGCQA